MADEMNTVGGDPNESPDAPENQVQTPETAEVPTSFFGDKEPKAGETCSVKVVSVDSENGMATIQYVASGEPDSDESGIEGMMSVAQKPEAQ